MRKPIIAANWKMNMTLGETELFLANFTLEIGDESDVEIVVIPPFTAIAKASELLARNPNIKLGAQNMHPEKSGAFTGEISAAMLRELYVRYAVIGHSRRQRVGGQRLAAFVESRDPHEH